MKKYDKKSNLIYKKLNHKPFLFTESDKELFFSHILNPEVYPSKTFLEAAKRYKDSRL